MLNRVSVIMPAYNSAAYIEDALRSALSQTHQPHEIIVVDDGSTDKTGEIVGSFGGIVRLIRQANAGPGVARNTAARVASGEWLAFLDADDLWMPEKLESQLAISVEHAMVYSDRLNFGLVGALATRQSDGVKLHQGRIFQNLLVEGNFITLSSVVIRRSIFDQLGGFNPAQSLRGVEDWELWLRVAKENSIGLVKDALVQYRCHASGISKNVKSMFAAQECVLDQVLDDVDPQLRRLARSRSASISAWFAMNSQQFGLSRQLYLRALKFAPLSPELWKGLVKCLLKRP